MVSFIYLHGLLSSSKSSKAKFLREKLEKMGSFYIPDFYPQQWEFEQMTSSYLLDKLSTWVKWDNNPLILIGSSFGGLIATRFLQLRTNHNIAALILLAPALNFYKLLINSTGSDSLKKWQQHGFTLVNHPVWDKQSKWSWKFIEDLKQNHNPMDVTIKIPTLLIHGAADEVIPINNSKEFAIKQAEQGAQWITHFLNDGNHQLSNVLAKVNFRIEEFLKNKKII